MDIKETVTALITQTQNKLAELTRQYTVGKVSSVQVMVAYLTAVDLFKDGYLYACRDFTKTQESRYREMAQMIEVALDNIRRDGLAFAREVAEKLDEADEAAAVRTAAFKQAASDLLN